MPSTGIIKLMSASEQELFAKKIRKEVEKNESKQKSSAKRRAKK